jgi:outer membrane immunogenic protein
VSVAALTGVVPAANAQAVTRRMPVQPATAPSTAPWAGFYVGGHAGLVRHQSTARDLDDFGNFFRLTEFPASTSVNRTVGLAGVHTGYNWQWRNVVYGAEADMSGAFGPPGGTTFGYSGAPAFVESHSSRLEWLSTFRARVGVDYNATLAYVTGGLALAGIRNSWGLGFVDGVGQPDLSFPFVDGNLRVGWTFGAGIEHRFAPNWSARVETLYVDLGSSRTLSRPAISPGFTDVGVFRSRWENTAMVARAALTYHWNASN